MKHDIWRHGVFTGAALAALLVAVSIPANVASASSAKPSAPRSVRASASAASAHVSWAPPASSGGSSVKSYVVTSHPSSHTCTSASKSCVVKGLKSGSAYTFTVVAKNRSGASPRSASSNKITIGVSIASARATYLSATSKFESSLTADIEAIDAWTATTPQGTETTDLTNLQATFTAFSGTLGKQEWPTAARSDIAAFIGDVNSVGAAEVALSSATSASNAALLIDTLFSDENKQVQGDFKVRTVLDAKQLITGPVTSTSTPVAVGTTQTVHDFYGDAFTVNVTQVLDPATAGAGSGLPDAGYRFVAVEATFSNTSNSDVEGDANLGMTVLGSDGQTYTADYGTAAECTNFTYGDVQVPTGDSATGCVLFQLPTAVSVKSVSFSLDSGFLDTAVWNS